LADTAKTQLIEAAERLFAQRGIAAVSLQEIRAASGQRNTSVVHYHFGSKQNLIEAIVEHRTHHVNLRRLTMLAELERDGRAEDLRGLVEAMIWPVAQSLGPGSYYARFLAQAMTDPVYRRMMDFVRMPRRRTEATGLWQRIGVRAEALVPGLPAAIRTQRLRIAGRTWIHALAEYESELDAGEAPLMPTAPFIANLVDMIVAMITAPISAATRSARRRAAAGEARTRRIGPRRAAGSGGGWSGVAERRGRQARHGSQA